MPTMKYFEMLTCSFCNHPAPGILLDGVEATSCDPNNNNQALCSVTAAVNLCFDCIEKIKDKVEWAGKTFGVPQPLREAPNYYRQVLLVGHCKPVFVAPKGYRIGLVIGDAILVEPDNDGRSEENKT